MTGEGALTRYELDERIATITLDDGKVNALSTAMTDEIKGRFDQAEADGAAVVLTGREQTLSAGFDIRCEPEGWPEMVAGGAELAERMLSYPRPVVAACNGNAIAMGAFLLLASDHRVGARGEFRIGLNEVAIGLTVPLFGVALARHRLTRPYADRCLITGVVLGPNDAREAGFIDQLVEPGEVLSAARALAGSLLAIDANAHAQTKLRLREQVLGGVREGIERIRSGEQPW